MKNLLILICLTAPFSFADSWSGTLVDAKCYDYARHNVNPTNTSLASRNLNGSLQACYPTEKTKSFGVVQQDWSFKKFDAAGNTKAAELVRSGQQSPLRITVTGAKQKKLVKVDAISPEQ